MAKVAEVDKVPLKLINKTPISKKDCKNYRSITILFTALDFH